MVPAPVNEKWSCNEFVTTNANLSISLWHDIRMQPGTTFRSFISHPSANQTAYISDSFNLFNVLQMSHGTPHEFDDDCGLDRFESWILTFGKKIYIALVQGFEYIFGRVWWYMTF